MVNAVNQSAIPLVGAGFRPRRNGQYMPGEYRRLTNVEVTEERLRNRRSIHSVHGDASGANAVRGSNSLGFLGTMGTFVLTATTAAQSAVGPGGTYVLWSPASLTVPANAGSYHRLLGYFKYNNKNYWLTLKYNAGVDIQIQLLHGNIDSNNDHPSAYGAGYFASLTATTIITVPVANLDYNKFEFKNFFIQGERLWIATSTALYFSKATDPTVFAVPNGGFFKFPEQIINQGMAVRESVYALCDNSVYAINYNTDPNTDAVVRRLSDNLGGEAGVIHQDTPYIVNNIGVYRIVNNYLEKILDNELDFGQDYYLNDINSFGEYLIFNKYSAVNYEKFDPDTQTQRVNLVPNPSLETNSTGWVGDTAYTTRARDAAKGFNRAASMKATKKNDVTTVNRRNRIGNPSFETNTVFWSLTGTGTAVSLTRVATGDGTWNARCECQPEGSGKSITNSFELTHTFNMGNLVVGQTYRFGLKTLRSFDTSSYNRLWMTIHWFDAGNNLLDFDQAVHLDGIKAVWAEKYVEGVAPVDASYAKVYITASFYQDYLRITGSSDDTVVMVNDAYFTEVAGTGPVGYFDGNTADTAEYVYDWLGAANVSESVQKGVAGTNPEISEYVNGVTGIAVTPNINYAIAAAFFATEVRRIKCRVRVYDAANALLNTSELDIGSSGDTADDAWKVMKWTWTAPSNAHHINVVFFATSMAWNESIWTDALIVEPSSTYTGYFDGATTDTTAVTYAWTGAADASTSTGVVTSIPRRLYATGREFTPGQAGNTLGYGVYAFNTNTGALHVIDFTDCRDTPNQRGHIVELLVNYTKDSSGNYNCFFRTARFESETDATYTYSSSVYFMNTAYDLDFFDYAVTSTSIVKKYSPKVEIEIENYIPAAAVNQYSTDGSPFTVKKFRNLEFTGKLPLSDICCKIAYDNQPYLPMVDLSVGDETLSRPHFVFRVALMQKARTLTLMVCNNGSDIPLNVDDPYGQFEISSWQVLWTPTNFRSKYRALTK